MADETKKRKMEPEAGRKRNHGKEEDETGAQ